MSDAISECMKDEMEMEQREFCKKERIHAHSLEQLLLEFEKARAKYDKAKREYETLKLKFIDAGYKVDDSNGLKIYNVLVW